MRDLKLFVGKLVLVGLVASPVLARPGGHGAHVHGVAELNLAMEGAALELMLTLPAGSLLGFERRATSPEQVEAVGKAKSLLADGGALFFFTGTDCELDEVDVDASAVLAESGDDHDEHDEHGHGKESHSDIVASYQFDCVNGAELKTVSVGDQGLPFGLDTINVMWVTGQSQGGATLKAERNAFELR